MGIVVKLQNTAAGTQTQHITSPVGLDSQTSRYLISQFISILCDACDTVQPTYVVSAFNGSEPLQLVCVDRRLIHVGSVMWDCSKTDVVCSDDATLTTNTSCTVQDGPLKDITVQQCEGKLHFLTHF